MDGDDDDECPSLIEAKVPVTILTGFLGSGKTTLLQRVLTEHHNLRIAVVVNEFEFGKSIEKGLTVQSSMKADDEWVELNNGCMCCSAQSQAVLALEKLMLRKGTFDLVLIETSGLADPGPVAAMFWQDEALCGSLYLCGIVAVVDARNALENLKTDASNEMTRQLLCADTILINKQDLVTSEQLRDVSGVMKQLNPAARVLSSSYAQVEDLRSLLFVHTVNRCGIESISANSCDDDGEHHVGDETSPFGQSIPHLHSSITSLSLCISGRDKGGCDQCRRAVFPTRRAVDHLCRDLLYHEGSESFSVVRMKAAVWVLPPQLPSGIDGGGSIAEPQLYQLQSICDLFDVQPMVSESIPRGCCRFIILGRQLNAERIKQLVAAHMVQ